MENHNEHQVGVLNDLLKINLDRIEGYKRAINESTDHPKLLPTFRDMEIRARINLLGGDPVDHKTLPGKIYHVWMDVRTAFSKTEKPVLDLCEFGEDAALKAYEMALSADGEMDPITRDMIVHQKAEIQKSHDIIKAMRDEAKSTKQF
jgi:uncharacterized protein (TIGR02284 family)